MSNRSISVLLSLPLLLLGATARAQTSYPMLMSLKPSAAQVGQASEHELESRYSMFGAYQVLITGDGVTGEIVTPMELDAEGNAPNLQKINVRFTVTADAQPGVRDYRLIGPTGASTLGQLVVVQDAVVSEEADNDLPEQALPIEDDDIIFLKILNIVNDTAACQLPLRIT